MAVRETQGDDLTQRCHLDRHEAWAYFAIVFLRQKKMITADAYHSLHNSTRRFEHEG